MLTEPGRRTLPIVEDGLSSGHASDTDNNNPILQVLYIFIYVNCVGNIKTLFF